MFQAGGRTQRTRQNEETVKIGGRNQPLTDALSRAIGGMNSSGKIKESLALAYWAKVVGQQAANASKAESVQNGVIFIRTRSSVWSHELNLHKARLIAGLNRLLGGAVIKDIVFRAQGVEPKAVVIEEEIPLEPELKTVILDADEQAELQHLLRKIFLEVEDDHARVSLSHRLTMEIRLRHWRLDHGWKLCPKCRTTHKTSYRLCPICRLCP